jgi:hypothetical protein
MSQPPRGPSDADLRFALVRRRYGDRLDAEELETLRRTVEAIVAQLAELRAVRLTNADEPLPQFSAFRADE